MRKIVLCMALMAVFAISSSALAGSQIYTEWKGVEGGSWSDAANWSAGLPIQVTPQGGPQGATFGKAGFKASRANTSPGITAGVTVATDQIVIGSGGAVGSAAIGGYLTVAGGTINLSEYLNIGNNNTTAVPETGTLNMNSGTINCGTRMAAEGRFIVGLKGDGTLNMNGGTINLTSFLTIADGAFATSKGTVNLLGGVINATDLKMAAGVLGTARMYVTNGVLQLTNAADLTGKIQGWIANGWINGGAGYDVFTAYDPDGGVTTVYATPTPEPATVCLLGLGVLGLLRKKK